MARNVKAGVSIGLCRTFSLNQCFAEEVAFNDFVEE